MYLILSRLGRVWFSGAIVGLVWLSWPRGVKTRRRPCTVYAGDRYKVRRYKGEVLITLVLVLDIMPLAVIYAVVYVYGKWLRIGCLIG